MSRPIQLESLRAMLCKWLPGVAPSVPLLPAASGSPTLQPRRGEATVGPSGPEVSDNTSRMP